MKRYAILVYGLVCYAVFFATFLYAIWFVFTMDTASSDLTRPLSARVLIDAVLLSLFALQHSIMARQTFKRAWTRIVPVAAERSTYVLFASLVLLLLIRFWQPLLGPVWKVENPLGITALRTLFILGWVTVLISTFLIDHFELFGLKQVWSFFTGREFKPLGFVTPGPYKFVRHPIYVGFIIAFWSTPTMTAGHFFFAIMTTGYILVAIQFEERDLTTFHGDHYRSYQKSVSMLTPWPRKKSS
jgi:protein-S-isoprenylcysteine O-methyltransferase Ste14